MTACARQLKDLPAGADAVVRRNEFHPAPFGVLENSRPVDFLGLGDPNGIGIHVPVHQKRPASAFSDKFEGAHVNQTEHQEYQGRRFLQAVRQADAHDQYGQKKNRRENEKSVDVSTQFRRNLQHDRPGFGRYRLDIPVGRSEHEKERQSHFQARPPELA